MPRLIDADALLEKKFRTRQFDGTARGWALEVVSAKDIDDAPTVDHESLRPHGHWIETEYCDNHFQPIRMCTNCGEEHGSDERLKFCPNCGAKMEESHER